MAPQDPAACRAPCRSPPGPVGALCGGNTSTSRLGWGRPTTWGSPRRRGASGQGGGSCSGQALVLLSRRGVGARAELPWTAGEGAGEPSGLPPPPRHRKTPAFKGQRLKAGSGPRRASTWPGPGGDWPSPINKDEERSLERGRDLLRAPRQSGGRVRSRSARPVPCPAPPLPRGHGRAPAETGRPGRGLAQPQSPQTASPGPSPHELGRDADIYVDTSSSHSQGEMVVCEKPGEGLPFRFLFLISDAHKFVRRLVPGPQQSVFQQRLESPEGPFSAWLGGRSASTLPFHLLPKRLLKSRAHAVGARHCVSHGGRKDGW